MILKSLAKHVIPGRVWRWMHLAKLRRQIAHFSPYVAEHAYDGVRRKIYVADGMSRDWYDHDWGPLPELKLLREDKLKPGARIFDCGAHQAVVAMMLAHEAGPSGHVIAVEGCAHNVAVGRKMLELNACSNVTIVHAAVADAPGRLRFVEELNGQVAKDGSGTWVDAVTIDQLAEKYGPPDVLFIDIEGHELKALRGATQTLARCPDCFIEVHLGCGLEDAGGSAGEIRSLFNLAQYRLFVWELDTNQEPRELLPDSPLPTVRFGLVAVCRT